MPEGPSLLILSEESQLFSGKKVLEASGYSKLDYDKISGQKVIALQSWGKHFLICFKSSYIRIHLLMFGSYRINERKEGKNPALSLVFKNGEVNFYACAVKHFEEDVNAVYDWEADVLSEKWNPKKATAKLKASKNLNVCDALLDQTVFSGVGNIIKNEALYRIKVHPKSRIDMLPAKQLKDLVKEAANYSWDFYHWKKKFELKKHWLIYKKPICPRCKIKSKKDHLGKGKRLTFYCNRCQVLYK